jgi:hypothetical protein
MCLGSRLASCAETSAVTPRGNAFWQQAGDA